MQNRVWVWERELEIKRVGETFNISLMSSSWIATQYYGLLVFLFSLESERF